MKNDNLKNVTIYTDGACSGNPGVGGYGAILLCMKNNKEIHKKEIAGNEEHTTNNRMELTAVIKALQELKYECNVEIYTDSRYVANSINNKWFDNWKNNNWNKKGGLANTDLWKELDIMLDKHNVEFHWVKGHADNEYNNRCDELAKIEIGILKDTIKKEKAIS